MQRLRFLSLVLLTSCALFLWPACAPTSTPTPALTPITVQLKWLHQAQFAGFYVADQNGYYADEGLKVNFSEGGAGVDLLTPVVDGTAQFGIADAAQLILAQADGLPIQAVSVIYRRSPVVFISAANLGIQRPEQLVGKTVRITSEIAPSFHAMMAQVGVTPDQYTEVTIPSTLERFAAGEVDVWGVYTNGFVLTVKQAGYKINSIYPDDYGVHFYADTLLATKDFIANHPDLTLRFLRATFKGWTYAIEHPAEIGALVVKYKPDADPTLETAKMTASLPLVNTGEDHIGWMKPEIWTGMEHTLRELGILTQPVDVTQIYTLQFLKETYGK